MARTLAELYRVLDNVRETWEPRLGNVDDDFYASGLVSFADVPHMPTARRIVADWKRSRDLGEGQA